MTTHNPKSTTIRLLGTLTLGLLLSCNNSTAPKQTGGAQAQGQPTTAGASPTTQQPVQPSTTPGAAQVIPDFTFYILKSGIRFTKADLAKDGNIVFILFDPTCSHCQHEARDLGQHYERVKNVNFYFVSMNDPALMSTFLETHAKPLVGKANIELLYDRNAEFINKFHIPSQYPATYVYGTDGMLKQHWNGERNIDEIIAAINQ